MHTNNQSEKFICKIDIKYRSKKKSFQRKGQYSGNSAGQVQQHFIRVCLKHYSHHLQLIGGAFLVVTVNYFSFLQMFYIEPNMCIYEITSSMNICRNIQEVLFELKELGVLLFQTKLYNQETFTNQLHFAPIQLSTKKCLFH